MYFLEGSHLSYPELNNRCVREDNYYFRTHIVQKCLYNNMCQRMLNSLVNSLSIWQSEHGKKSMKNDPVKYKTVRQFLISDLETRRN